MEFSRKADSEIISVVSSKAFFMYWFHTSTNTRIRYSPISLSAEKFRRAILEFYLNKTKIFVTLLIACDGNRNHLKKRVALQ